MTTKEWILLFIPIIINGVFLFIFQNIISIKFDKQIKKREVKMNVLEPFRNKITEAIFDVNKLKDSMFRQKNISKEIKDYVNKIHEVKNLHLAYDNILPSYEKEMYELTSSLDICIEIINNRKEQFKQEEIDCILENINKNEAILKQISEKCFNLML